MAVVSMVVGGVTDTRARFVAKVDGGGPVRVAVADNPSMTGAVFSDSEAVDADGVAKVEVTGLAPDTRHWWRVEDDATVDTTTGQFLTDPPVGSQASFTIACIGDAGLTPEHPGVAGEATNRLSNHPAFDLVRERALAEGWRRVAHLGDICYYDLGSGEHGLSSAGSAAQYRSMWDDILAQPRQHQLYREVPLVYVWDDHDYGPNNSDSTAPGRDNACTVYRERMPHYDLPAGSGANPVYQSFQIGRTLLIVSDTRSSRVTGSTMLGAEQLAWLEDVLTNSDAEALVWLMPTPWHAFASDTWGGFVDERQQIVDLMVATGWARRTVMVNADDHAIAMVSAINQPHGHWPVMLCASIDATPSTSGGGQYDEFEPGRDQYGTVTVDDRGSSIVVTLRAWRGDELRMAHSHAIHVSSPLSVVGGVQEFGQLVSGSHDVVVEARLLTTWQDGPEPEGIELPILDGDVQFDATADVFATFDLTTSGVDEATGRGLFPRRGRDLLAPFGNEVFIRRGIDMGDQVLWSGLGYFRIESVEQDGTADAPIRLAGRDRMGGIIDARPLQPREFPPTAAVGTVVAQLVGEAHPLASVVFDDDTPFATLGRTLVVEDDRYAALKEVADAFGKIMFWDGDGLLRFETAPDESTPVWEVRAGRGGVLITSARRMTREGVYNGVVAMGEAGETDAPPVRGVAVDLGPNSPTNWNGRFGRVPRFYASPLIRTTAQATSAARAILSRSLGAPFSADFTAVPNPALRPWHPVRVTQSDGNREIHVIETLTMPLVADAEMPATTREKATVVIGGLA